MKIINKRTGEVIEICRANPRPSESGELPCDSFQELCDEWEEFNEHH